MRLVLYSGGQHRGNHELHRALVSLCGNKKRIKFTYIPYCSDNANVYYKRAIRRYKSFGVSDFHSLAVDKPIDDRDLKSALDSDVIYLAGGNTFYFLNCLRRSGLIPKLQKFAQSGGILAGLSAGALIMTPNIQLARVPRFDADDNDVGLKDLSALGLTTFEFSPHYSPNASRDRSLLSYSEKTKNPIYACADGAGIIVDGDHFTATGRTSVFFRGVKQRLIA